MTKEIGLSGLWLKSVSPRGRFVVIINEAAGHQSLPILRTSQHALDLCVESIFNHEECALFYFRQETLLTGASRIRGYITCYLMTTFAPIGTYHNLNRTMRMTLGVNFKHHLIPRDGQGCWVLYRWPSAVTHQSLILFRS